MKKWMGIFIAVSAIVLLVVRSVAGEEISKEAEFGRICSEGEYFSQIARCENKNYVVYKNQEQQQALISNIDKNLYQYEALATVNLDRVYYLYSFFNEGKKCFGIEPADLAKGEFWIPAVFEAEGTLFAAGGTEDEILVSILGEDNETVTEYALPLYFDYGYDYDYDLDYDYGYDYEEFNEWEERYSFSIAEDHYAVGGVYYEGDLFVVLEDGTIYLQDVEAQEVGITIDEETLMTCFPKGMIEGAKEEWLVVCKNYAAIKYIPLILLISIFIVFWFYGIRKENHLIYRLICYAEIICVLALAVLGTVFTDKLVKQEVLESGMEAGYILEEMKLQQKADGTVPSKVYLDAVNKREYFLEDLIIAEPEGGEVILAKTLPAGMNLYDFYGTECKALVEQTAESNQSVMMYLEDSGSNSYIVSSRNWSQIEAQSVLLAVISKAEIESNMGTIISSLWNVIFMTMLIATIIHMILFLLFSFRWNRFLAGMQYVAAKRKPYTEFPNRNDGLYSAWAVLDRIGHNTVKLQYERDVLQQSYYRFVPKGIEQLLRNPSLTDVKVGDRNKVEGCMVYFGMENIKDKAEDKYLEVMTESMSLTHKIRERHEGIFISADAELHNRKIFFENKGLGAIPFVTDLYSLHEAKKDLADLGVSMLLHYGDYQYGISGVDQMMTPFMYCCQEKILDEYRKKLAKANVKLVLTQQAYLAVGNGTAVRYIGFISSEKMQETIKLYECIEGYTREKRKTIEDTDVIFQKALNLFYANEFYQARNLFNEVLKMNEQDEVARGYFFRCEKYLNNRDVEISYDLFEKSV